MKSHTLSCQNACVYLFADKLNSLTVFSPLSPLVLPDSPNSHFDEDALEVGSLNAGTEVSLRQLNTLRKKDD